MTRVVKGCLRRSLLSGLAIAAIGLMGGAAPVMAQGGSAGAVARSDAGWSDVVARAAAAVVRVSADRGAVAPPAGPMSDDTFMDEMMRRFMEREHGADPQRLRMLPGGGAQAEGSGFVIDADGLVVTSDALVGGARDVSVTMEDGTSLAAELAGHDPETGLAVLRIATNTPLPALDWGSSQSVELGDEVLALGRSEAFGATAWPGRLAARDADRGLLVIDDPLGMSALGAPLLGEDGEVLGVVGVQVGPDAPYSRIAVASEEAQRVIGELVRSGTVARGYLGVRIQPITAGLATALGLQESSGALVTEVQPHTPAARAGLQEGDVVLALDGEAIETPEALSRRVAELQPGATARLEVWRDHATMNIEATLTAAPADPGTIGAGTKETASTDMPQLGLSLSELTPELRRQLGLPEDAAGVAVASVDGSGAEESGIRSGDVIVAIQRQPVATLSDVRRLVDQARDRGKDTILLFVERDGERRFVAIPLGAS